MNYDIVQFVGISNYISIPVINGLIMVYDCNAIYPISNNFVFEISSVQANSLNITRMPNFVNNGDYVQLQIRGVQYTSIAILGYNSERIYIDLLGSFTMHMNYWQVILIV